MTPFTLPTVLPPMLYFLEDRRRKVKGVKLTPFAKLFDWQKKKQIQVDQKFVERDWLAVI